MNQNQTTHTLSPESLSLILVFLFILGRILFELHLTFEFLNVSLNTLESEEWRTILFDILERPLMAFSFLFYLPLIYLPLLLVFSSGSLLSAKTSDLTKGSIAQNELDL